MRKVILALLLVLSVTIPQYSCNQSSAAVSIKPTSSVVPTAEIQGITYPSKEETIGRMIESLESNVVRYEWDDFTSCNIGILSQCVTRKTASELNYQYAEDYKDFLEYLEANKGKEGLMQTGSWRNLVSYYCGATGRPIKGIVADLNKAGFSNSEISNFEFLSDPKILKLTKIDQTGEYWKNKNNVVKYLKAWSTLL